MKSAVMGWHTLIYMAALLWMDMLPPKSQAQRLCPKFEYDDSPSGQEKPDDSTDACINYTVMYFNNKRTEILWDARENFPDMNITMFFEYNNQERKQCPQYITDQGYNTGCVFQAEQSAYLRVSIWDTNGTKELYKDELHIFAFLKPSPPDDVAFQWAHDKLTVQCKPPDDPQCFTFELKYKSNFDKDWQFRQKFCCQLQDQGFDPVKCYSFQARLTFHCGSYSSDWSNQTFWKNGSSVDSCDIDPNPDIVTVLTLVMIGFMTKSVIFLCVCRLKRIRQTLMPIVPDATNIYSELFSSYHGDFQEWIKKTENVLDTSKLECIQEEEACVIEEENDGCLGGAKVAAIVTTNC